jgi:hypothetical protein
MGRDGLRRLPAMIGGMPPSGYSGEGSTYMDHVVGPSIPFVVELLESSDGGDWFTRRLGPNGGSAEAIVRMIAREWMPCGLTLPWDHYGYALPTRACLAYGARRTGNDMYLRLLDRYADWSHEVGVGWGYDDLVWTLIWWPDAVQRAVPARLVAKCFAPWSEPDVGAALVSDDDQLYLMQMWDRSNPCYPTRAHVNPNGLVLCAYGSPLTVDGVPRKDCRAFEYGDTWREVSNITFAPIRTNFGPGCAGAHSVLLVDRRDGLHARSGYEQAALVTFAEREVTSDVTPLYREHWPDTVAVRRRSRLVEDRFWLIEDLARFSAPHEVTARWYLRPSLMQDGAGAAIETAEGVRLDLAPLLGAADFAVREIEGYPDRLDGSSLQFDFTARGSACRWLWLAWPTRTREVAVDLSDEWEVASVAEAPGDLTAALGAFSANALRLPFTCPTFMLADVPLARRWVYRKRFRLPQGGPFWLRLPHGMLAPRLWVNGREADLRVHAPLIDLMPPHIPLPAMNAGAALEVMVYVECGVSQYGPGDRGGSGFWGAPALLAAIPGERLVSAALQDGTVAVRSTARSWRVPHTLMEAP